MVLGSGFVGVCSTVGEVVEEEGVITDTEEVVEVKGDSWEEEKPLWGLLLLERGLLEEVEEEKEVEGERL